MMRKPAPRSLPELTRCTLLSSTLIDWLRLRSTKSSTKSAPDRDAGHHAAGGASGGHHHLAPHGNEAFEDSRWAGWGAGAKMREEALGCPLDGVFRELRLSIGKVVIDRTTRGPTVGEDIRERRRAHASGTDERGGAAHHARPAIGRHTRPLDYDGHHSA